MQDSKKQKTSQIKKEINHYENLLHKDIQINFVKLIILIVSIFVFGHSKSFFYKFYDNSQVKKIESLKQIEQETLNLEKVQQIADINYNINQNITYSKGSIKEDQILSIIRGKILESALCKNLNITIQKITSINQETIKLIDNKSDIVNFAHIVNDLNTGNFINIYNIEVNLNSDYEGIAHNIVGLMQNNLPGSVILKSISIDTNDNAAGGLFNIKFNKQTVFFDENRLSVKINLVWFLMEKK